MNKQEIEEKFKKEKFKDLLKEHQTTAIWDVVMFAISVLCLIIICFTPCVEVSGEKFYKNFMQSFRVDQINSDGNQSTSKDNEKLIEGRINAWMLAIEKACNKDDAESVVLADKLANALLPDSVQFCLIEDDAEFNAALEENAKQYSKLCLSYNMIDYMKILLSESVFKSDGVGVLSVDGFGIFYWMLNSILFFLVILFEIVLLMFSIIKLCFNKRYTQYMYNKCYTNYQNGKHKVKGGVYSVSFVFYVIFIIFNLCSPRRTKYFKQPARIFLSAVNISPLIYVIASISIIVFILSKINDIRKKRLHGLMCVYA